MIDVLSPLITESDNVSSPLLDIILINIVEPQKSSKKNAYHLAKELIIKTNETMEQYIQQVKIKSRLNGLRVNDINEIWFVLSFQFFNQALVMDKVNKSYQISSRIYDLIYELNVICPSILLQVLPQLECKLKAGSESERLSKFLTNPKIVDDAVIRICKLIESLNFYRGRCIVGSNVFGKKFHTRQTI